MMRDYLFFGCFKWPPLGARPCYRVGRGPNRSWLTAFSAPYVRVDEELFRVQIGPNAERRKLLLIKPEVDSVLGVDSQVLRYVQ